jgi:CRP-like cAMP-binding protein
MAIRTTIARAALGRAGGHKRLSRAAVIGVTERRLARGYKKRWGEMGDMASVKNLVPSAELKAEFERLATTVAKPRGTVLFQRGDKPAGVYLIRSGQISLGLDYENSIYPARILGPGAIVGLPASVSGNAYSLTATVVEDSELAFVPRDGVVACLKKNPTFCFQVMDILSDEIADIRAAFKQNGAKLRATA